MAGVFDFCPARMVARTKPPVNENRGMSMNGWHFSSKPSVPYQKTFVVKLQGLRWYLTGSGAYDIGTDPYFNARRLELFYEQNGTWDNFFFPHPHFGTLPCRFAEPVEVPEAVPNSGGLIEGFDITLVHHNPGYSSW